MINAWAARDLRAAADVVEAGWCQHTMHRVTRAPDTGDRVTTHCAAGALAVVTGYHHVAGRVGEVVVALPGLQDRWCWAVDALAKFLGDSVYAWNDEEGRTADEVATAMRDCAEKVAASETIGERLP